MRLPSIPWPVRYLLTGPGSLSAGERLPYMAGFRAKQEHRSKARNSRHRCLARFPPVYRPRINNNQGNIRVVQDNIRGHIYHLVSHYRIHHLYHTKHIQPIAAFPEPDVHHPF